MTAKKILKCTLWMFCHFFITIMPQMANGQAMMIPEIKFERDSNYSATYSEVRSFFHNAAQASGQIQYSSFGQSDSGEPLSVCIIDSKAQFEPLGHKDKRAVVLINNAIHPGEPCGVEASMLLVRDILREEIIQQALKELVILIVPVYNIGGMLNRSSDSRANQVGPGAYGFRGNALNLDLNRDFIKSDSRNTRSLVKLIQRWKPDLFIDTHTSNGADYQYTMTLIPNSKGRLTPALEHFVHEQMLPEVYEAMQSSGYEMNPYVHLKDQTPEKGIMAFNDLGRYSMGFGALHHIPSFTTEAHMLKPYADRVWATYQFIHHALQYVAVHRKELKEARQNSISSYGEQSRVPIKLKLDTSDYKELMFRGYEAKYRKSLVTGLERLYYDQKAPYTRNITFWERYTAELSVDVPKTYVLPQAYEEVAQLLRLNGVEMARARMDSIANSRSYRIDNYETVNRAYEGHFLHSDVEVSEVELDFQVRRGDYIIETDQAARRFIVETLEPQAPDSYFAWNYFDGILMQKEYFSPYLFEDIAKQLLETNAELKAEFEQRKKLDSAFAASARAQLTYIYQRSVHYEKTHNLYPVGRIFN